MPEEQIIREEIKNKLVKVFERYGYKPVETSILDFYDVAARKYVGGEEILKEIYRLKDKGNRELCLRYELTFKLAKLIAMNPNVKFPFKRYEIGKVFRDGPVKAGRLREFTQCDVDCVGIKSFVIDAELIALAFDAFSSLGLDVFVKVNNRKLLFSIFKECKLKNNQFVDAALSLDKIEKIGKDNVKKELESKGIERKKIEKIFSLLEEIEKEKGNEKRIAVVKEKLKSKEALEAINELNDFLGFCKLFVPNKMKDIVFEPFLARGLAYYTSLMFEFYLKKSKIKGSVAAGGRYDGLINRFMKSDREIASTGISFGLDTIYEALKEKSFKSERKIPKVLVIPINALEKAIFVLNELRKKVEADIILEKSLKKALDFANKKDIPFVVFVGKKELKEGKFKLRNMETGKETLLSLNELLSFFDKQ